MRSLYYSSLNAKMGRYRKDSNLRELLDQIHNENLKEELEKDNALYNKVAAEVRKDQLKKQYQDMLSTPGQREKEIEAEIDREAMKRNIINERNQTRLAPLKQLRDKAIKQKAFNALFSNKIGSKDAKERERKKHERKQLEGQNYEYAISELQNELAAERAKPKAGRPKGRKNNPKKNRLFA